MDNPHTKEQTMKNNLFLQSGNPLGLLINSLFLAMVWNVNKLQSVLFCRALSFLSRWYNMGSTFPNQPTASSRQALFAYPYFIIDFSEDKKHSTEIITKRLLPVLLFYTSGSQPACNLLANVQLAFIVPTLVGLGIFIAVPG